MKPSLSKVIVAMIALIVCAGCDHPLRRGISVAMEPHAPEFSSELSQIADEVDATALDLRLTRDFDVETAKLLRMWSGAVPTGDGSLGLTLACEQREAELIVITFSLLNAKAEPEEVRASRLELTRRLRRAIAAQRVRVISPDPADEQELAGFT